MQGIKERVPDMTLGGIGVNVWTLCLLLTQFAYLQMEIKRSSFQPTSSPFSAGGC